MLKTPPMKNAIDNKNPHQTISRAVADDIPSIIKIMQQNLVVLKKSSAESYQFLENSGFILGKLSEVEIAERICDVKNSMVFVVKENCEALGYLIARDIAKQNQKIRDEVLFFAEAKKFQKILYYNQIAK